MSTQNNHWLLPEGIDELLPEQAARLEQLRRELLDSYASWGYELVITPFVEYLDTLLTGTGKDLELQTFKMTDQVSGRLLGIRADITPQAARIDAHQLCTDAPSRLCYIGSVFRTRGEGLFASRSPLQIGAELYGHAGVESDVEILCLMMSTLDIAGVKNVSLDLGHVGIFKGLARQAKLDAAQEAALFNALQRKAIPEIKSLVNSWALPESVAAMLCVLAELNGNAEILAEARQLLAKADKDVLDAIDYIQQVATQIETQLPGIAVHFDLAELRAYQYQTGVVFAAFVPGSGQEVARGGRYDHIGEKFGRARPATGFSADLKTLMNYGQQSTPKTVQKLLAPWVEDAALDQLINELRATGTTVIRSLPGQSGDAQEMNCTGRLEKSQNTWVQINF